MTLALKNVVKRVGAETHIYETNLALQNEGFNILLGTTLAGKTTLMQLMAGLEKPTSGEVWFRGKNVTGMPVQARNVSMVYQQFINYPNFTVFENIASPLKVARISATEIKRRVGQIAELLRLSPMLDRRPSELSGGQQQRTALARALVKDADVVLLDEPLANLDYKLREELRDELPRLFSGRDCIVVYATTEPTEALLFGGNTATLFPGSNLVDNSGNEVSFTGAAIVTCDAPYIAAVLDVNQNVQAGAFLVPDGSGTFAGSISSKWTQPIDISTVDFNDWATGFGANVLGAALDPDDPSIVNFDITDGIIGLNNAVPCTFNANGPGAGATLVASDAAEGGTGIAIDDAAAVAAPLVVQLQQPFTDGEDVSVHEFTGTITRIDGCPRERRSTACWPGRLYRPDHCS